MFSLGLEPPCNADEALSSVTGGQQPQRRPETRSIRRRSRRSVQLIMPGTQWCGAGNVSTDVQSYGSIVATDRCCQQHDRCAYTIEGFSSNYGLFNYRFHTISHCECDDVYVTPHSFAQLLVTSDCNSRDPACSSVISAKPWGDRSTRPATVPIHLGTSPLSCLQ